MPDRATALAAANLRRQQTALSAVEQAIRTLHRSGTGITFAAVAKTAGVARSWLYQHDELRRRIGRLRDAPPPPAVDAVRASNQSLQRITEALRLELNRLREENKALRDQLARQLGINRIESRRVTAVVGADMSSPSSPTVIRNSSPPS